MKSDVIVCEAVREWKVDTLAGFADHVVDAGEWGLNAEIRDRGLTPDVVIELTAGITLDQSLRAVRRAGRIVIVGNVDPAAVPVLPGAVIVRELTILGSNGTTREDLEIALRLIGAGAIKPVISHQLPLAEAAAAHRLMESRRNLGRVVLKIPG